MSVHQSYACTPLELVLLFCCPMQECRNSPLVGGVRLNVPEIMLLISCSTISNLYLFYCLGTGGLSMAIRNLQRARHSASIIGPTMVGPSKFFKIEVLRQLETPFWIQILQITEPFC